MRPLLDTPSRPFSSIHSFFSKLSRLEEDAKRQQERIAELEEQLARKQAEEQQPTLLTVEAVKASSELQLQAPMQLSKSQVAPVRASPPLSLVDDSGSNEEALGGIIDWQAVGTLPPDPSCSNR